MSYKDLESLSGSLKYQQHKNNFGAGYNPTIRFHLVDRKHTRQKYDAKYFKSKQSKRGR